MVKAAFLDRDSTLIKDDGYTVCVADLIWEKDAIAGLSMLDSMGYKLIVITNQSGIARGYYTEKEMNVFHSFMNNDLQQKADIKIEKFYHCPHHSEGVIRKFSISCNCRKPGNKLFKQAILDFSIEVNSSIVIGNNVSDIIPAINQGINIGFLLNGNLPLEKKLSNIMAVKNWMEIINNLSA